MGIPFPIDQHARPNRDPILHGRSLQLLEGVRGEVALATREESHEVVCSISRPRGQPAFLRPGVSPKENTAEVMRAVFPACSDELRWGESAGAQ